MITITIGLFVANITEHFTYLYSFYTQCFGGGGGGGYVGVYIIISFSPVFTVYLQQFFERKRLTKRNEQYNNGLQTPLDRKSVVSQDIKGFCLLEQMHSTEMLCKY